MAKRRIYEIAKERGITTQELAERLRAAGVEVKSNLSSVEESDVDRLFASASTGVAEGTKEKKKSAPRKAATKPVAREQQAGEAAGDGPAAQPHPEAVAGSQPTAGKSETEDGRPSKKSQAPKPAVGPRIVATAEELRAKEQAARGARPGGAARKGRPRRPRLEDLPTVVGPGVPVRKGVKPSGTVLRKGEEPKPAPNPAPPKPAGSGGPTPGSRGKSPSAPPGRPPRSAAPSGAAPAPNPPPPPAAGAGE